MGTLKHTLHLIAFLWFIPVCIGAVTGMRKERLLPALLLTALGSWIGVFIAFFLRDDSPMGKRRRINKQLNQPSPHARRRIHTATRIPGPSRQIDF